MAEIRHFIARQRPGRSGAAGEFASAVGGTLIRLMDRLTDPPRPPRFRSGAGLRHGALLTRFADDLVARRTAA